MAKSDKAKGSAKPKKTTKRVAGAAAMKAKKKAPRKALPLPADAPPPAKRARAPKAVRRAADRHLAPLELRAGKADARILEQLWDTVEARRLSGDIAISHSARLLSRGTAKVAQKLGEEAVECVIEATQGHRQGTVLESADLLYHLMVVWVDAGIQPQEVWAELARRQGISGIAEKAARPKAIVRAAQTTKLP